MGMSGQSLKQAPGIPDTLSDSWKGEDVGRMEGVCCVWESGIKKVTYEIGVMGQMGKRRQQRLKY